MPSSTALTMASLWRRTFLESSLTSSILVRQALASHDSSLSLASAPLPALNTSRRRILAEQVGPAGGLVLLATLSSDSPGPR